MDDYFAKGFIKVVGVIWLGFIMLMFISFIVGCDSGWAIAGWEVK